MAKKILYYTADYPDGIGRKALRGLSREEKLEIMEAWFRQHFEDPANETPYESAEGGYIYIWGGPYDARQELEAEFSPIIPQGIIDELVQKLEGECWDWAPVRKEPDEDDWVYEDETSSDELDLLSASLATSKPQFGNNVDVEGRQKVRAALNVAEAALKDAAGPHGMIGHNQPPEPIDVPPIPERDRRDLLASIVEIKVELGKDEPTLSNATSLARKMKGAIAAVIKWSGKKIDSGLDAYVKSLGTAAGVATIAMLPPIYRELVVAMSGAYQAVVEWVSALISPF